MEKEGTRGSSRGVFYYITEFFFFFARMLPLCWALVMKITASGTSGGSL